MKTIPGSETLKVLIKKSYIWSDSSIGAVLLETPSASLVITFPQAKSLCEYLKEFVEHYHG